MLPSVGVFGTDHQAQILIALFKAAGFPVTAICGSTYESAKSLANDLKVAFHTNKIQELLLHNEVDIVCVAGTPHQYAEVCTKALSIGKHVFSCTPAGLTLKEANDMLNKAQYYPKLLSVLNHPLRFLSAYSEAKNLIKEGRIGEILICECRIHIKSLIGSSFDWHCDSTMGGGVLQTYGSHIVDILSFLLEQKATQAHGILETFVKQTDKMPNFRQISSDDFCSFQLKYPSGIRACVTLNAHMPNNFVQEVMLVGSKGFLKIVNCNLYGQISGSDTVECLYTEEQGDRSLYSSFEDILPGMYLLGCEQLIEGIKLAFESTQLMGMDQSTDRRNADINLITAAANFENGCYTRSVLDAIFESNKQRQWVEIKQPGEEFRDNTFWSSKECSLQQSGMNNTDNRVLKPRTDTQKQRSSPHVSKKR